MSTEPLPVPGDADLERLLADELDALTATPVDELRRRRHVTAAATAARTPTRTPGSERARRRHPIAATVMGSAAAVAVVLALASARLLPDPVQSAVAHVAERVGIQLPGADAHPATDPAADGGDRGAGDPFAVGRSERGRSAEPATVPAATPPSSAARPDTTTAPGAGRPLGAPADAVTPPEPGSHPEPEGPPEPPSVPEPPFVPEPPSVPEPPELRPDDGPRADVPVVASPDLSA